jgi:hypothetical protein
MKIDKLPTVLYYSFFPTFLLVCYLFYFLYI